MDNRGNLITDRWEYLQIDMSEWDMFVYRVSPPIDEFYSPYGQWTAKEIEFGVHIQSEEKFFSCIETFQNTFINHLGWQGWEAYAMTGGIIPAHYFKRKYYL